MGGTLAVVLPPTLCVPICDVVLAAASCIHGKPYSAYYFCTVRGSPCWHTSLRRARRRARLRLNRPAKPLAFNRLQAHHGTHQFAASMGKQWGNSWRRSGSYRGGWQGKQWDDSWQDDWP